MTWLLAIPALILFLWFSAHYNFWRPGVPWSAPRILMYHSVSAEEPSMGINLSPARFEAQIAWFARHGFEFCTVSGLLAAPASGQKRVAITFDDGFENNYSVALPILRQYGAKATIYLSPAKPDTVLLSESQIRDMADSGDVEFGAHTVDHINLKNVSDEEARSQLRRSRKLAEQLSGMPCVAFAYPYGRYEERHVAMVEEAGFTSAVTTRKKIIRNLSEHRFELPRVSVNGEMNHLQFLIAVRKGRYRV